jgi:hypothetical protein
MYDSTQPPEPRQDVRVNGNHNIVIVVGRDLLVRLKGLRRGAKVAGTVLGLGILSSPMFYPARGAAWPEGKTAVCTDGWFSASHTRSGTCSSHGGVLEWRYPASHPIWKHRAASSLAMAN